LEKKNNQCRRGGPEPSVHHLDRDKFFDRFDIAARFYLDPAPSPLGIFFRVFDLLDHILRQVACLDFRDGPVAEDKSDPKIALAGGEEKQVPPFMERLQGPTRLRAVILPLFGGLAVCGCGLAVYGCDMLLDLCP
ncbi:MAG: hypothetical protein WCI87_03360, partial [Euryarchaeota archaeon]